MTVKMMMIMMNKDKSKITKRKRKSEAGTSIVKPKNQKKAKQTNVALSVRRNGSSNRS